VVGARLGRRRRRVRASRSAIRERCCAPFDGGTTWLVEDGGTTTFLDDVTAVGPFEAWASGDGGVLVHRVP
jgi:hypothetical protein